MSVFKKCNFFSFYAHVHNFFVSQFLIALQEFQMLDLSLMTAVVVIVKSFCEERIAHAY